MQGRSPFLIAAWALGLVALAAWVAGAGDAFVLFPAAMAGLFVGLWWSRHRRR